MSELGHGDRPLVSDDDLGQDGLNERVVADEANVREMRPRRRASHVLLCLVALADEDVALSVALEETQRGFVQVDSERNLPKGDTVTTMVPPVPRCECLRVGRIVARATRARSLTGKNPRTTARKQTMACRPTTRPPARPPPVRPPTRPPAPPKLKSVNGEVWKEVWTRHVDCMRVEISWGATDLPQRAFSTITAIGTSSNTWNLPTRPPHRLRHLDARILALPLALSPQAFGRDAAVTSPRAASNLSSTAPVLGVMPLRFCSDVQAATRHWRTTSTAVARATASGVISSSQRATRLSTVSARNASLIKSANSSSVRSGHRRRAAIRRNWTTTGSAAKSART